MEQKGNMDIILLDIEMGGINGVETARQIREKDNRAILFFISCYDQYCKEIINVQPFRFIDKPVSEAELESSFKEAFKAMSQKEEIFEVSKCDLKTLKITEKTEKRIIRSEYKSPQDEP